MDPIDTILRQSFTMRTTRFSTLAVAAALIGSSSALAPRPEVSMTRRSATLAVIGSAFAAAPAFAKEQKTPEEIAYIEAQKEKMRKKIEASKKSYRTTNDLVKDRKQNVNYTCLLDPNKCDAKDEKN